ncbi:MAG: 2,3-oxidosqualene cyclase, partial [Methylococcaceae bacterium]
MTTTQTASDAATLSAASDNAYSYLLGLQKPGGDWEGEMVWCTMILAQAVIVRTIIGEPYNEAEQRQIIRHFEITQAANGAWGMHPESAGYLFFTTLAYVALRLLGLPPDTPMLSQARTWLRGQPGGVQSIPTWGKFWLAIIGLYDYRGLNAIPPELFLLPKWLPFHPSRFYCHTRLIYLAIAFIGGSRFVASLPANLRDELRGELYDKPYAEIDFAVLRHSLAPCDVYVPITPLLHRIYDVLAVFERWHSGRLRQKALKVCFERILYE